MPFGRYKIIVDYPQQAEYHDQTHYPCTPVLTLSTILILILTMQYPLILRTNTPTDADWNLLCYGRFLLRRLHLHNKDWQNLTGTGTGTGVALALVTLAPSPNIYCWGLYTVHRHPTSMHRVHSYPYSPPPHTSININNIDIDIMQHPLNFAGKSPTPGRD